MRSRDAIWITGVGTANPLGKSYAAIAENQLAGKSGIRAVTDLDLTRFPSRMAGQIGALPVPPGWPGGDFTGADAMVQLLHWCAIQALQDAGWWERRTEVRVGLTLGLGAEWLLFWERNRNQG